MVHWQYRGEETMYRKTYEIWQVSAQALLANAELQEDGRYEIRFDFEKAIHSDSVRKTEAALLYSRVSCKSGFW